MSKGFDNIILYDVLLNFYMLFLFYPFPEIIELSGRSGDGGGGMR